LLVIQNVHPYSDELKKAILDLNQTISTDLDIANFTGQSSLYSTEYSLLNSSLPSILPQVTMLTSNISSINSGVYMLSQNLSALNLNLYQTVDGINQTAQLVYGVPAAFIGVWQQIASQGMTDPYLINLQANATTCQITGNFGGNPYSIGYYTAFFNVWNASFLQYPNDALSILDRESLAINESIPLFLNSPQLDTETKQIAMTVASGLNVMNWNQNEAIASLAETFLSANIPTDLSAQLGASPQELTSQLYKFGPSPSNLTILNYAITLTANGLQNISDIGIGFSPTELLNEAVNLGSSPSYADQWNLACEFIANATQKAFENSPLFTINSSSLATLLNCLSNATITDTEKAIQSAIIDLSYENYPYQPTSAITNNFVGTDNSTVLVILNFSSEPNVKAIAQVKNDVLNSTLQSLGKTYVTGSPVLIHDVENAFVPALEITIGPGIIISLLIVGILFLAPLAAIIPVLMGGISTVISLASIYFGIVIVGKGNITFLTPTLTILLLLGLAVDYAVLQLRRTKEERQQGKSVEESVGLSVRWAGQAVLTAGITVIVAYIVMAVVNVPIFSDVGTAIAISVSILLAASLTLLPAIQIALNDRIFWPGLRRTRKNSPSSRLRHLASSILRRKKPIAVIISLLALGAFYVEVTTPTGSDFLKLIPNFESNQGLTAISHSFGGASIAPATIVVTTPTPIIYGENQFNQTLMDQLELITNSAAQSPNVASVTSPTRPFGSIFNYSQLKEMSDTLRPQYESQIYSMIGKDNKTARITIGLTYEATSQAAMTSLQKVEKNVNSLVLANDVAVVFGGETQSSIDSKAFMATLLPEVVIILSIAVYIILFVQLRSAFTPLRLIFTILCSVAFALAIVACVFYYASNLPILDFAPLFVVVTMLGVGIDYDIFFLARMREEALKGKTDDEAIKTAVEKVWITILGLGLVLSTVFASLFITGIAILQEIALAVAAAIIIDVLVVILFFVPSLMGLAQKLNWWPHKNPKTTIEEVEGA
jgi:RND superfamily putative drug exporter